MTDLKRCPFCGGGAMLAVIKDEFLEAWTEVRCLRIGCLAAIEMHGSGPREAENAIAAWNHREYAEVAK